MILSTVSQITSQVRWGNVHELISFDLSRDLASKVELHSVLNGGGGRSSVDCGV